MHDGVEGAHLLKEGADVAANRMLTDIDLKKIKVLQMRMAMRKVDKHGFRSSSEEEDNDNSDFEKEGDQEEGEEEMEEGEEEMSEEPEQTGRVTRNRSKLI